MIAVLEKYFQRFLKPGTAMLAKIIARELLT
jgi:hypothetical protein